MSQDNYILIDYENVQPAHLDMLRGRGFRIRIFLGPAQDRLPLATVSLLQVLGPDLEYVQTSASGPNALDFYIAYFLGRKTLQEPSARFYIISKDTGFDPLLRHLRAQGIACRRVHGIDEICREQALLQAAQSLPIDDMLARVKEHLSKPSLTRPRSVKTLRTTIGALFAKRLRDAQIDDLIFAMKCEGFLIQDSPRVIYRMDRPDTSQHGSESTASLDSSALTQQIAGLMN